MELIEKGKAIGELTQQADAMKNWSDRYADERKGILTAIRIIESVPKVDAETVIRCKDCKYLRFTGTIWRCQNRIVMMLCEPNDYCSRAERKEK